MVHISAQFCCTFKLGYANQQAKPLTYEGNTPCISISMDGCPMCVDVYIYTYKFNHQSMVLINPHQQDQQALIPTHTPNLINL